MSHQQHGRKRRALRVLAVVSVASSASVLAGSAWPRSFAVDQPPPPRVEKVDPPSWWPAHTLNPVRLLIRGTGLHRARVRARTAALVPSAVAANDAGTYVFVDVAIDPSAPPGEHPLVLETAGGAASVPFRLEAPLDPARNFRGVTSDDVVYLIMPDRFANGDPANDVPSGAPPATTDRRNPRAYHGGDFRGIAERLPYLRALGATALWLTPWYDNQNDWQTCPQPWCPTTHYHGYHTIDYYAVEDRFGDMAALRELVRQAHAQGLKVIQDQVANHVGSHHPWLEHPPLEGWFHPRRVQRPFRTDLLLSPHTPPAARRSVLDAWFTDHLPDLAQEEPEVARYEIQNALWWVGMTGIDGIRQDTAQFMPRAFLRDLAAALHRQYPSLCMVGEVTGRDPAHTAFFMGGRAGWDGVDTLLDSVFDFPLWHASRGAFTGTRPVSDLREVLRYDGLYPDASRLTTLVGNHDVPRFLSLEGGTLDGFMLHVAFTLTMRGTPQLYYGDEIAMAGGGDPDNRRDFPGGFPGDAVDAFTAEGRRGDAARMYEWTRDWLRLRREHTALRRGELVDLRWDDESYLYARRDSQETVIVALNRTAAAKELSAPADLLDLPEGALLVPVGAQAEAGQVTGRLLRVIAPPKTIVAYVVEGPARR